MSGLVFAASTADERTVPFYLEGILPSPTLTETDFLGRGGFSDVPPGFVTVQALKDGVVVAEENGAANPGEITWFALSPLPAR